MVHTDDVTSSEGHGHGLTLDGRRLSVFHLPDRFHQALVEAKVSERCDRSRRQRARHLADRADMGGERADTVVREGGKRACVVREQAENVPPQQSITQYTMIIFLYVKSRHGSRHYMQLQTISKPCFLETLFIFDVIFAILCLNMSDSITDRSCHCKVAWDIVHCHL